MEQTKVISSDGQVVVTPIQQHGNVPVIAYQPTISGVAGAAVVATATDRPSRPPVGRWLDNICDWVKKYFFL